MYLLHSYSQLTYTSDAYYYIYLFELAIKLISKYSLISNNEM